MNSVIVDGKVFDISYKKRGDFVYAMYVGDNFAGQIFKMKKSWSVVPKTSHILAPVNGLRTRWDATELILKMEGYYVKS
jgi:hypothetical protein